MKILTPKLVQFYQCDFCEKKYVRRPYMVNHEDICYSNPNRNCDTCKQEGVIDPDNSAQNCPSCLIARTHGGKSYIEGEVKDENTQF